MKDKGSKFILSENLLGSLDSINKLGDDVDMEEQRPLQYGERLKRPRFLSSSDATRAEISSQEMIWHY